MRIFTIIFTLVLTFGFSIGINAQEIEKNKLTVYGKVKTYAKADRATFSISIQGYGKSLALAFDDANKQMYTISSKLLEIGLTEDNISTSFFSTNKNYGEKAFLSSKKDFIAKMSVSIITKNMSLLEKIVIALSQSKIEKIDDISFELTIIEELKEKAFIKALQKAKNKAHLISETLDITYKGVVEFQELKQNEQPYSSFKYKSNTPFNAIMLDEAVGDIGKGIFAEELSFVSEVMIVYEIADKK